MDRGVLVTEQGGEMRGGMYGKVPVAWGIQAA